MAPAVTHVLWDMDGVLLDTETFYTTVQQQILAKYGKEFTWALKSKMMGKKALEAAQVLIDDLQLAGQLSAEEFVALREVELDRLFPTAQLMPGAERLVRHLRAHGVPICVATSSHARHFALKTQAHTELFALFDHIVTGARRGAAGRHAPPCLQPPLQRGRCQRYRRLRRPPPPPPWPVAPQPARLPAFPPPGDQVQQGKPHPEIFQLAASKFSPAPAPESCLVFEDAPSGVEAALNAGMNVVGAIPGAAGGRCAGNPCTPQPAAGGLSSASPGALRAWRRLDMPADAAAAARRPQVMVPDSNLDRAQCSRAHQVIDSLEQFDPAAWGLPPFQDSS
jgi:beta-phosphoglucomutase-like phosphatase (HAD superfamily)